MKLYNLRIFPVLVISLFLTLRIATGDVIHGNRLSYLDEPNNPWIMERGMPKLITPQWIGEKGVEAVIVLAIDDMSGDGQHFRNYLSPIIDRLKDIDGRGPVSITCNQPDPSHPNMQWFLEQGVSLETHTLTHPCPVLQRDRPLAVASKDYHDCVDLLASIPNNRPVGFRFGCMDGQNTPSPRAYSEILNGISKGGNFMFMSSSVGMVFTPDDPELPREIFSKSAKGYNRFSRYLMKGFVSYIENYPYPFVVGKKIWELPFAYPNDYTGQALFGNQNPIMIEDFKAAIDATVAKSGAVSLCFHSGGWMLSDQMVDVVDHAHRTHGKKIKFLNMREMHDLMVENLQAGHPLRNKKGEDNGVRILDINNNGFMDIVIGNPEAKLTRIWDPLKRIWNETPFPLQIDDNIRFGVIHQNGFPVVIKVTQEGPFIGWRFDGTEWVLDDSVVKFENQATPRINGIDGGVRLIDIDGDGICELVLVEPSNSEVFQRVENIWKKCPFALPQGTSLMTHTGSDSGMRFADLDKDGGMDVIYSDGYGFATWLFNDMEKGWARKGLSGKRQDDEHPIERNHIPAIVRKDGTNNGAWIKRNRMYWQNEDTGSVLPHHIDQRSFSDLTGAEAHQPRSPIASLKSMEVHPAFKVELIASEPLVMDPVDMAWGPNGTLWVAEFACYPNGIDHNGQPGSRVVSLKDTNADGVYDQRTVYADGLETANTVLPWRDRVLTVAPPNIWFLRDTTGDGKADKRELLYEGFRRGNQQHRGNGLTWGLDGWIYVSNGDSGGKIRSTQTNKILDLGGGFDLRIRPDTGEIEHATGMTQHGKSRDPWGNWIAGNNSFGWQIVLEDHDLRREKKIHHPPARNNLFGVIDLFPISQVLSHWEGYIPPPIGSPGKLTSGCGYTFYRDSLFDGLIKPSIYFSCPVHNCIHRETYSMDGMQMKTSRAQDESETEFLRSLDSWFRPASIRTGPDGALYVADLYRLVIEHPEWIDDRLEREMISDGRMRAGDDRGRIYRISPKSKVLRKPVHLANLNPVALAKALESSNGWQRDTAHMMLTWLGESKQREASMALREVLSSKLPEARVQALSALADINVLSVKDIHKGLTDNHPGARRHALRLGESLISQNESLGLIALELLNDNDVKVQQQAALCLGSWNDSRAALALGKFLIKNTNRPYLRYAAITSASRFPDQVLLAILEDKQTPEAVDLCNELIELLGNQTKNLVSKLFERIAQPETNGMYQSWQFDAAAKLLTKVGDEASLKKDLDAMYQAAREVIDNSSSTFDKRVAAITFLTTENKFPEDDVNRLTSLLSPSTPVELQIKAAWALMKGNKQSVKRKLLEDWSSHGPKVRSTLISQFLEREDQLLIFFAEAAKNRELKSSLDASQRQRLLRHENEEIRNQAENLFGGSTTQDRGEVIERYHEALRSVGDRQKGREVFVTHCATCHVLDGIGNAIGPDIAALTTRTPQAYLTAILNPNDSVSENWMQFIATTKDEQTISGALVEETSASITIADIDGTRRQVSRSNLVSLKSMGFSLMPEGFENSIPVSSMTDLLAYIEIAGEPRKKFNNNEPKLVNQAEDLSVTLPASTAEIFGPNIKFEQRYKNLGFWGSESDRAEWTFSLKLEGEFDLWVDWALAGSNNENRILFSASDKSLSAKVPTTGSWDDYRWGRVGKMKLSAGKHRLITKSEGPIQGGYLIDLKAIRLIPRQGGKIKGGVDWKHSDNTQVSLEDKQPKPFQEKPHVIPGIIEAEHYDEGPAGIAYHDNDFDNQGEDYRKNTQVDIEKRNDASNGHGIGWTRKGEWLHYTVEVKKEGVYQIKMPVASNKRGGLFHLEIKGNAITDPIRIPDTGGWTILKTITYQGVKLKKGIHIIRVVMDQEGPSGSIGDIDYFEFSLAE